MVKLFKSLMSLNAVKAEKVKKERKKAFLDVRTYSCQVMEKNNSLEEKRPAEERAGRTFLRLGTQPGALMTAAGSPLLVFFYLSLVKQQSRIIQ